MKVPQRGWQPALLGGDANNFSQQMSSASLLLLLTVQEWYSYRKGFIQGKEKEKMLPTPFRMLASITHLTTRENGGVKGASDFTPPFCSSRAQEWEERIAACRRLVTPHVPQLFGSSNNESFTRVAGAQWRVLPVAAVLQCASYPQYSVFSHQWKTSRELGRAAELPPGALCYQGASWCSKFVLLVVSGLPENEAK